MSRKELTARLSAARNVRASNAFIVAAAREWRIGDSFMWVQFIPKTFVTVIKIFYLRNPPLQINVALFNHVYPLTYLKQQACLYSLTFNTALKIILILNYVLFYCKLPITEADVRFKKDHCGLEIPATVTFNWRNFQVT